MKFTIKHETKKRMRIHVATKRMTFEQADILEYYLSNQINITFAKVYDRTADAVIEYVGNRADVITAVRTFHYETADVPCEVVENSGRALNAYYQEKIAGRLMGRVLRRLILPMDIRKIFITIKSMKYIYAGLKTLAKKKLEVSVLDAVAIAVSILRGDFSTAGSVMFLLGLGDILEEWTHKRSVDDLARSMALGVEKVWMLSDDNREVLVSSKNVEVGDKVVVHMGNIVPFDGVVVSGEAMINQASLTGESMPVRKYQDSVVYAGTVNDEGEITIRVTEKGGSSRYEKIVTMIEETEKLKSNAESKANHLADKLVPYTLAGTALTYLLTRNATKAIAVLMVDFSCALKLSMPIAVLSAIREASMHHITVKGGKFMEAVSEADTIVFDKTGTLTKAQPTVKDVVSFCDKEPKELLRIAACLEEHFPHSMAKAVTKKAEQEGLEHDEMHSKVNYIVAHGISTTIEDKPAIIGSYHFVFEDEKCEIDPGYQERFDALPEECSLLYLALEGKLAAVICIEDPVREEADAVLNSLKKVGIKKVVMMTGDSYKTAKAIAKRVGVDEFYAEVLPEDKARFVEKEKELGHKVIMIGDGINDSPALSAADVGIAISDGAQIAREIADITVSADSLYEILTLKVLSDCLMKRIRRNYRFIVGFNTALIGLGVTGVFQPTTSALLHNVSTIGIALDSTKNML
ncbi:MAG: heavy metal translocating P-type ATPase [Lachnospiraceae bacterium]|nr:heavy metal translocating P-type ATPase [Lachnospiraceae bacterium]